MSELHTLEPTVGNGTDEGPSDPSALLGAGGARPEPAQGETRPTALEALGRAVAFFVQLYALYMLVWVFSLLPAHQQDGHFSRLAVLAVRTRYALWRLMAVGMNE
ncbi:MAG: hypothetical protein HYY05_05615 [Chloroflexi bacterium]|nr:hypothetical protein [Chloroflexota bacterium]